MEYNVVHRHFLLLFSHLVNYFLLSPLIQPSFLLFSRLTFPRLFISLPLSSSILSSLHPLQIDHINTARALIIIEPSAFLAIEDSPARSWLMALMERTFWAHSSNSPDPTVRTTAKEVVKRIMQDNEIRINQSKRTKLVRSSSYG